METTIVWVSRLFWAAERKLNTPGLELRWHSRLDVQPNRNCQAGEIIATRNRRNEEKVTVIILIPIIAVIIQHH